MRAFVTGASGFAGVSLCKVLLRDGHQVVGLARASSNRRPLDELGITVVTGDIRQREGLARAMEGSDVVFHLAAAFREARLSESDYTAVNVTGTENVIRAAATARVRRFVHCSTIGVVGNTGSVPADETRAMDSADDPYNRSKIEGEVLARRLFDELGLEGVVARPAAGYGPGEMRYLKLFTGIAKRRFIMFGSGETLYNLAFIDDLCRGLILCGTHPRAAGQVFNLGAAENTTLNNLAAEVARVVGRPSASVPHVPLWPIIIAARMVEALCRPFGIEPPLHRRRVGFFVVNRAMTISKAQSMLGYTPRTTLPDGLRITADWYRAQNLL
jgi:nucleoside-diphosphate-sugar epimerase